MARITRPLQTRLRRRLRSGDAILLLVAVLIGALAGLATVVQSAVSHGLQALLYGVSINRLSALASIHHPSKLLFLPLGGLLLVLVTKLFKSRPTPVDVIEANALHGGRIPWRDSLQVSLQTIISNGFGASVGLEAAYAQAGGGLASTIGAWLQLKRADLRMLVGAGAGAAIGAAFSSPLAGAFYAFEIVIGAYTPAAMAPVAAAALSGVLVARSMGAAPFLTVASTAHGQSLTSYLLFAGLGLVCAAVGILIMRFQALAERTVQRWRKPFIPLPVIGGFLLIPLAWISPQALSSGHGAMRLEIAVQPALQFLLLVFALKTVASIVSLSFGFRGGLFFASLFLGSLLGPAYAQVVNVIAGQPLLSTIDATLVGMAALSVTIVGGPMTLSLLILETTHDFALTGVVLTAALCASAITRDFFGYSFSTWRLHLRGAKIRSARDIGWGSELTAGRLMQKHPPLFSANLSIEEFRSTYPIGSTGRVLLHDGNGHFSGIVETAMAYDYHLDPAAAVGDLAAKSDASVTEVAAVGEILELFDDLDTDDLAVIAPDGRVLGMLTERYVARRYMEASDRAQATLFGE
ncbi:MAG: chloride channel protein [Novosphingobium sp.]